MQLIRLAVSHFAAIGQVDIEFGSGLNVLYGPNDLGKSTIAESIRLALLLPYSSSYAEDYTPWNRGGDPVVELTFATEAQRIWRVRKHFGKRGSSQLEESRNGRDFENVEQGRAVDGKLREILRWGIPEPGGSSALKGLPDSFLAGVLLSTQDDVSGILACNLQSDLVSSGKDRIAAALEAIAQDPLFLELLKKTRETYLNAYREDGVKSIRKGSVFREAAERVNEAREEKDRWQKTVEDSESAERRVRELTGGREIRRERLASAMEHYASLEILARQTAERAACEERVRSADAELDRVRKVHRDAETSERKLADLTRAAKEFEVAAKSAKQEHTHALAALDAAREEARKQQTDPALNNTQLLLRVAEAERAFQSAEQSIRVISSAKELANEALNKERALKEQEKITKAATKALAEAEMRQTQANSELVHCELLQRVLEFQAATREVNAAEQDAARQAQLETHLKAASEERAHLLAQRNAIIVPADRSVASMRKLAEELNAARAALNVGMVVTLTPYRALDVVLRSDDGDANSFSTADPQQMEANAELEMTIAGIAKIQIQGGRREAQARASAFEERWQQEVMPHLRAAGVNRLEELANKVEDARELDAAIKQQESELRSLEQQISQLSGVKEKLRRATRLVDDLRRSLGDIDGEKLGAEVNALGQDAAPKLARRQKELLGQLEAMRGKSGKAGQEKAIAEERTRHLRDSLHSARGSSELALQPFPDGIDAALVAARAQSDDHRQRVRSLRTQLDSLDKQIAERDKQLEIAQETAKNKVDRAAAALDMAQKSETAAHAEKASEHGRWEELCKQRDAADLGLAENKLRQAKQQYDLLPLPARTVNNEEVIAADSEVKKLHSELEGLDKDIHRAQGGLEQVGGAVARERLYDAAAALEDAERREKEIEAEYEAWKLLLEQMKEAEAAQASNLGLALTPAVADRFTELTRERYEMVKINPQLGTEGVVVAGATRPASLLSIGTRDQLSTLFRLALAEYLSSAIVLDDQLVQSDGPRMQWFQDLLYEKARLFQIIVLTCRPSDYLSSTSFVPGSGPVHLDMGDHPVRAIDLGRALQRG
jgi:DNA repair exonuclease SbcCD ATPase subunit